MGERGTTLPEYKARMKEGQKQIYYISGSSRAAAAASPVLDRLKQQGHGAMPHTVDPLSVRTVAPPQATCRPSVPGSGPA